MDLTPRFEPGLLNAWLLCVPLLAHGIIIVALRKDVARRMSDMTGYTSRERLVTAAASLAPYPWMALTVWTPFVPGLGWLIPGAAVYAAGLCSLVATVHVFLKTPPDKPFSEGIFKVSRNPLYVSATLMFLGISILTRNAVLLGFLIVNLVLQHFMILAEERVCRQKYGDWYGRYLEKVPRYLLIR